MNPLAFLDIGSKLIDKLIPDPAAKQAAQLKLLEMQQAGEFKQIDTDLQMTRDQVEVNKIEAASSSFFKSGWRPATGWVCVSGLGYQALLNPLLSWVSSMFNLMPPPAIDTKDLIGILIALLGLGTMRMTERLRGKA